MRGTLAGWDVSASPLGWSLTCWWKAGGARLHVGDRGGCHETAASMDPSGARRPTLMDALHAPALRTRSRGRRSDAGGLPVTRGTGVTSSRARQSPSLQPMTSPLVDSPTSHGSKLMPGAEGGCSPGALGRCTDWGRLVRGGVSTRVERLDGRRWCATCGPARRARSSCLRQSPAAGRAR